MARSSGSIHVADNSVTSINDALQQVLFMIDELRGEHSSTTIKVGPHTHSGGTSGSDTTSQDGGPITPQTIDHDSLINVTTDQHHAKLHETLHRSGGADALKLDNLATPDDNTDLNATTTEHGLLPKLSGQNTDFLNGTGAWSAPSGGGGASSDKDTEFVDAPLTTPIWEFIQNDRSMKVDAINDDSPVALATVGDIDGFKLADSKTSSANVTSGNFTVGFVFRAYRPIRCTGASFWWAGGVGAKSVKLSIWHFGGSLVTSVTVDVNAAGKYFGWWSSPITLGTYLDNNANMVFSFGSYVTDGSYYIRDDSLQFQYDAYNIWWGMFGIAYGKSFASGDNRPDSNDSFWHPLQLEGLSFVD